MTLPTYEILALRYATMQNRTKAENFLFPDDHHAVMPIDYYVWVIRGEGRLFVVDTGFGQKIASQRGRTLLRSPVESLASVGVDAAEVNDVILTHLHYDHAGCLDAFPKARFHLQDAEIAFATGRCMCHQVLRAPMELEDVLDTVRQVYAGRVLFHDGSATLAPGISLHLVGGHSGGLQIVRVHTPRGWFWRPTPRISGRISAVASHSRWWWTCTKWPRAGGCARNWRTGPITSSPATTRWC